MTTNVQHLATEDITHDPRVEAFHKMFYEMAQWGLTWGSTNYFGIRMWKAPSDLQIYQELLYDIKPKLVIETGTAYGGSALYFAHLLDQLSSGRVLSIDLAELKKDYPRHPRINYLSGRSSVDREVLKEVRKFEDSPCVVVLDSDHSKAHVLAELQAYAEFVTPGSYLVVEDTNVNGHPVYPEHGPGPQEALDVWLPQHPEFKVDHAKSAKYLFSCHTWLTKRRV